MKGTRTSTPLPQVSSLHALMFPLRDAGDRSSCHTEQLNVSFGGRDCGGGDSGRGCHLFLKETRAPELQGTKPQAVTSSKGTAAEEAWTLEHLETDQ